MFKEYYYFMFYYLRSIKTNDTPAFNAYLLISLLQGLNIESIYIIVAYIFRFSYTPNKNIIIYIGLSLSIALFIINYFLLFAQRKNIFDKYELLSQKIKSKRMIYFWAYVTISVIIFFVSVANR